MLHLLSAFVAQHQLGKFALTMLVLAVYVGGTSVILCCAAGSTAAEASKGDGRDG